jgi:protein-S-isoprenylcysteine O-methyltransferase Ste14
MSAGEARETLLVRYGNFLFKYRNALFSILLLTLFFTTRPSVAPNDWVIDIVGVLVSLSGQILRIAVIGYKYIIRGGKNARIYSEDLVTTGFFAHCRNPLYAGNILVLLGLFIIHNNFWVYVIGVPFFLTGYAAIAAAEEAFLLGKFGDGYRAYMRDVPRWVPRLTGFKESVAGMTFNWRRVVLKEYGSTFAWTATAIVLMARQTLLHFDYQERALYLNALAVTLVLLSIAYGTARYLKLTRKLRS